MKEGKERCFNNQCLKADALLYTKNFSVQFFTISVLLLLVQVAILMSASYMKPYFENVMFTSILPFGEVFTHVLSCSFFALKL